MRLREHISKSDLYRYYGKSGFTTLLKGYLTSGTIRWHVAFRLVSSANPFGRLCGCVLWVLSRTRHTIAISHGAQIGYGLYIGHGGPVIVNKTVKIGDNCNLSPYRVIGSNYLMQPRLAIMYILVRLFALLKMPLLVIT